MSSQLLMVGIGCGPASSGPTTLLSDTFTGTNGTALTSHTPDIPGTGTYTSVVGTSPTIQGNKAEVTNQSGTVVVYDVSQSAVTAQADVSMNTANANTAGGVVVRETDVNNFWLCHLRGDGNLILFENSGGTFTQRASAAVTVNVNTTYTIKLVASGTNMTGYYQGTSEFTYGSASSNQTATKVGIRCFCNASGVTVDIDNFLVTNP